MKYDKKHRAEVIEIYPNEGKAAVRFRFRNRDRIECVSARREYQLKVGDKGTAYYVSTASFGEWCFAPLESEKM
jgi:hypothetical protein